MKKILLFLLTILIINKSLLFSMNLQSFYIERFIDTVDNIRDEYIDQLKNKMNFFNDDIVFSYYHLGYTYYFKARHSADDNDFYRAYIEINKSKEYFNKTLKKLEELIKIQKKQKIRIVEIFRKLHANEEKILNRTKKPKELLNKIRKSLRKANYFCETGKLSKSFKILNKADHDLTILLKNTLLLNRYKSKLNIIQTKLLNKKKEANYSEDIAIEKANSEIKKARDYLNKKDYNKVNKKLTLMQEYYKKITDIMSERKKEDKKSLKKDILLDKYDKLKNNLFLYKEFLINNEDKDIRNYIKELEREIIRFEYARTIKNKKEIIYRTDNLFYELEKRKKIILAKKEKFNNIEKFLRNTKDIIDTKKALISSNSEINLLINYIEKLIKKCFDSVISKDEKNAESIVKEISKKLELLKENNSKIILNKKEELENIIEHLKNQKKIWGNSLTKDYGILSIVKKANKIFSEGKKYFNKLEYIKAQELFEASKSLFELAKNMKNH